LAELVSQYVTKGMQVYVEGKIETRSWKTDSGETKYSTSCLANEVKFLSKSGNAGQPASAKATAPAASDFDDDIPF